MILCSERVRRTGFTLIEIMIVIAIIAILAGIAIPNIAQARFEAGLTACQENCRIGVQTMQMARVRHSLSELAKIMEGTTYSTSPTADYLAGVLEDFVKAGYLTRSPKCTVNGDDYYFEEFVDKEGLGLEWFYKDPSYTQVIPNHTTNILYVCCSLAHKCITGGAAHPCYEATLGPCFT